MHSYRSIAPLLLTASALTSALGCELIAAVDHSLLDQTASVTTGTGGAGGTTSNAGGGGNGGLGGQGGSGGEAGSTTSQGGGGMGGAGGGEPCTIADDCPGQDTDCSIRTCIGQQCGVDLTPAGTPLQMQTAGNCEQEECDGNGGVTSSVDNDDLPDDENPCTDDVCTAGSPSNPASSQGTMCGVDLVCDGMGSCVGCVDPAECPGQDDECQTRTCIAGVCDFDFTLAGTPLAMQDAGDCQEQQCDGSGNVVGADDNLDLPVDGSQCTDDVCTLGMPDNPDLAPGTTCNEGGGTVCDGNGACVQCVNPSTCPVGANECQIATCVAGMCGFSNLPDGTLTVQQTIGDCQQSQCDGGGNIVDVTLDTDLPDDSNPCTDDVCDAGVPSNPDVGAGTSCGGDQVCDGMGNCIGCVDPITCPGQDDDCKTRTCTAGTCGFDFEPPGTATTQQTAGDCQEQQCDGNGTAQSVADNDDAPPDDGNDCTLDICTNGVPGHPNTNPGTTCDDNGGTVCNGNGACVACVSPANCPAAPNECQIPTCISNTCGFGDVAGGTPTSLQTAGDCQRNQCDGNGNIESVADNTDAPPDEGNQCTADVCVAGAPQHPDAMAGTTCNQNGGAVCDGNGACVECLAPANCPAAPNECQVPTCTANVCGFADVMAGTPTTQQTAGDCQQSQCDGNGNITSIADNADVPADDGSQCTGEVCMAGAPQHPNLPPDTMCTQNGGTVCNATGACVQCNVPTQCSGSDTECQTRTCTGNACGVNNQPPGTLTSVQTPGDCQQNQCDGNGNIVSAANNADAPPDDGNQCTSDVCVAGAPQHPNLPPDTTCTQNGGSFCNATGSCVECNAPTQCPGSDTECQMRTCIANACGVNLVAAGTPTSDQTPNDCLQNECDGAGMIVSDPDNADLPVDDGNQCTDQACAAGAPMFPFSLTGTPCTQNGGTGCDGAGMCVPAPQVANTSPADGGAAIASTSIAVTFTTAMNPSTLTGQTTAGACSGSVQVSINDFASCIAFSSASATLSVGDTVATFTAAPGLLVNRAYKIRVTTAAASAAGLALPSQYTQVTGFTTTSPNLCEGSLVISQVYGGGGNATAAYTHDFIELHNRGATAVSLVGKSLQYTSGAGTIWNNPIVLSGSIAPGGYYLVQLSSSGAIGAPLPAPDLSVTLPLISATVGKVALINSATQIPTGACPPAALTLDFVGYGAANCSEGNAAAPAPANPTAVVRVQAGCGDVNRNASDFEVLTPTPRNTASAPAACVCTVQNESNVGLEADYCTTQFPLSLNVQTGMPTPLVYGQIFEAGVTEAGGANGSVRAQVGYGPATANPEYESSWQWTNATFNVQAGSNDEYQAMFTAPAVGSYRYVYRFSLNQGVSWTYCDQNAGDAGAGSNAGLTFELGDVPVLTVTP